MERTEFKLLIIEAEKAIVDKIVEATGNLFQQVIIADDGEKGFSLYKKNKPDLVIANLNLPSISGIELIQKLKSENHWVRIILYADSSESSELGSAIESDIKGFLLTPLDNDQLQNICSDQLSKIKRYRSTRAQEDRRKIVEEQYDKSKRILQVISQTTALFFRTGFYEKNINKVLELIGKVTEASRVYVYQNFIENEEEYTTRLYEWTAEGIMPVIGNLSVTHRHIATSGFERWIKVMKTDKGYISGFIRNFSLTEQKRLAEHSIKSVLALPIFVENKWWGFIGLDDCLHERTWTEPEISALEILTNNLGLAIQRNEIDEELIRLNRELEKKIKDRTRDLEFEVAERSMAEALLKDSEEKYRLIYENATYGIMLIQKNRIVLVNPALLDILEEVPRNLIGKKFSKIVKKKDRYAVKRQFSKSKHDDLQNVFHVKVKTRKTKHKWLELKPASIEWYGEPAHLVFVSNITPRKNAEDELHLLNQNLEQRVDEEVKRIEQQQQLLAQKSKLESIGELSAGLAHEINQPLVSISMGLDNMLMTIDHPECDIGYIKNKINLLFKDIERIKNIIEHVRIFSRDQQKVKLEKVNISRVIGDAMSMVRKMLEGEKITLKEKCLSDTVFILGNYHRLEQVFLNLISNARFAVNEKERKSTQNDYIKQIKISCSKNGKNIILEVRDNGIGIPPEILTNIFNPFFTTKSESKGTGLGLSISYGIIQEMGGEITAESIENEFTSMKIHLPVYTKDQ